MQPERRYFEADDLEIRADVGEDGAPRVSGYFARYNVMSPTYGKMREKIAPGFFDEALGRDDVKALFNHDTSGSWAVEGGHAPASLGRQRSIRDDFSDSRHADRQGGHGDLRLRNLSAHRSRLPWLPRMGHLGKASDGVWERTLLRVGQLFDVSVVTEPFYPQTDVGLREMRSQLDESFKRWAEAHPEEVNPPVELEKPTEMDEARLRLAAL